MLRRLVSIFLSLVLVVVSIRAEAQTPTITPSTSPPVCYPPFDQPKYQLGVWGSPPQGMYLAWYCPGKFIRTSTCLVGKWAEIAPQAQDAPKMTAAQKLALYNATVIPTYVWDPLQTAACVAAFTALDAGTPAPIWQVPAGANQPVRTWDALNTPRSDLGMVTAGTPCQCNVKVVDGAPPFCEIGGVPNAASPGTLIPANLAVKCTQKFPKPQGGTIGVQ